jgi:hypothetical protein
MDSLFKPIQEVLKAERFDIPTASDKVPVLVFPKDREACGVDRFLKEYERTQPAPYRRRGTYTAASVDSLLAWMTANTPAESPVFGSGIENLGGEWRKPKLSLIGIGNYSDLLDAEWHDLRCVYSFPVSDAWNVWATAHGNFMSQADFAEFIEARIYDLSAPVARETLSEAVTRFIEHTGGDKGTTPTKVVELSRGLKLMSAAKIDAKLNLSSGETTLSYTEEHTGAGGRPINVPQLFYIRIPVFFGQPSVLIGVRLRYRTVGTGVSWCVSLFAPELIVSEQFDAACEAVRKAKRTVYLGSPDTP